MAKPDVRVKLSAEGVAEVVSALKKIQSESTKTAAKSKGGFRGLNSVLGGTKNLLGGLGLAVGFVTFKRLISGAIEAADQINKLGAKVGATTENLSALALVARTSDADMNQVGSALIRMNKNIGDAAAGIPTAVGFLKDLGLGLSDFKGKDSVETFAMISKELFTLEDQLVRNRVAIGLFGRSGAQLMPTMKALADEGLAAVIRRAEELGVLIDHDLAAASEQIKDDVEILKMQSEAMGISFMAGFGPEASQMLQALSGDLGQNTKSWKDFGAGVGQVMKTIVAVVGSAFDYVGTHIGLFAVKIDAGIRALKATLRGATDEAKKITDDAEKYIIRTELDLQKRMAGRFELASKPAPAPAGSPSTLGTAGGDGTEAAELAGRRALALQSSLDREIALVKAAAATKVKEEKRELETGLQSLAQYFTDRKTVIAEAYKDEIALLDAKEASLADFVDPVAAEKERAKIATQRAAAELKHGEALADLTQKELDGLRDLAQERVDLEMRLLEMSGQRTAAARLGMQEQLDAVDELARKEGLSAAAREASVERMREALTAGIDFDEATIAADAALSELTAARADIDAQAAEGLIAQIDAETQLLELEQGRLDTLRELAEALILAAEATGDPEKIERANNFAASIDQISYAIERSTNIWVQFKTAAIDSAQAALEEFFMDGISGADSLGDAFKSMAKSIVDSLRRIAAEWLASEAMEWISSSFGGGDFIGPMPAASGGLVRGRGTGTSDSIPALLSNQEFVTRAWAVGQPGVLKQLRRINRYGARALAAPAIATIPAARFAGGGLVDAGGGKGGGTVEGTVKLGLEEGLVVREISTPAGQRVILETLTNNRRAVRSALGI